MTELKSIQLIKAAKELNIGLHTAVQHLAGNGHVVEDKPNTKLSPEQYEILLKAFKKDSEVKKQAETIVIGPQHAKKEITPEPKPVVTEIVRQTPKLEGFKIVDKIDVDKKRGEKKPSVEAPVETKVEEVPDSAPIEVKVEPPAPIEEPVPAPEQQPTPVAAPEEVPEPVHISEVAPEPIAVEEIQQEITAVAIPEEVAASPEDNVHKTQYGTLQGLNVKGKIVLPPDPRQAKPAAKPNEKEKRKRIEKKAVDVNRVGSDQGGAGSTDRFPSRDRPQQGVGNRRPGGPPYHGPRKPGETAPKPEETSGLSAKEIEERKKQLLNRLGANTGKKTAPSTKNKKKSKGENDQEVETEVVKKIRVTAVSYTHLTLPTKA
jgi:translation initiation factor IF-2